MKTVANYKSSPLTPIPILHLSTLLTAGCGSMYIMFFGYKESADVHKKSGENFLLYLKYRRRK